MSVQNWNRDLRGQLTTKVLVTIRNSTINNANDIISEVKDWTNKHKYANISHFIEVAVMQLIDRELEDKIKNG